MNEPEAHDVVVVRPVRSIWIASVCAAGFIVAFTLVGVFLRQSDTGVAFRTADQVAMIGLGVLLGAGTMLWAMPKVRADADGIEVRNVLAKRAFGWSEVLSISFPDGASWARLELPDDEYYSVMALQAVDGQRAVEGVRALRRLHRQAHRA